MWDFVSPKRDRFSQEFKPRKPKYYKELDIGDYVLFYLAKTFPDDSPIEGGRSIIGKARLGSPFIIQGEYVERDNISNNLPYFVFLLEPCVFKSSITIEPLKYGIGKGRGQPIVEISKNMYDSINKLGICQPIEQEDE